MSLHLPQALAHRILILISTLFFISAQEGYGVPEKILLRQSDIDRWTQSGNSIRIETGSYHVSEALTFPKETQTAIEPGARFEIDPGLAIIFYGQLQAVGEAQRPIEFIVFSPKNKSWLDITGEFIESFVEGFARLVLPESLSRVPLEKVKHALKKRISLSKEKWGGLVLSGEGARGSEIRYAVIRDAFYPFYKDERMKPDERMYLGGLSVFDTGAGISHVYFEGNRSNAFHALRAEVRLTECIFSENLDDGIDFLDSSGVIESNLLIRCQSDALDIKSSTVQILGNRILDSGDSGIEIQEHSTAEIRDNVVLGCGKEAVKIVDESSASLLSNTLVGNRVAVCLFVRKSESYRWSGKVQGMSSNFLVDNREDLKRDKTSEIHD